MSDDVDTQEGGAVELSAGIAGESKALALLPNTALTAVNVFRPGGVNAILSQIKAIVAATPTDISTEKGRRAIRSLAFKVAQTKTGLLAMKLQLTQSARAQIKAVNDDGNLIEAELDHLKAQVTAELDEVEQKERRRAEEHEAGIKMLLDYTKIERAGSLQQVEEAIAHVNKVADERDWELFRKRAGDARAAAIDHLNKLAVSTRLRLAEEALAAERATEEAEAERQRQEEAKKAREAEIAERAAETARLKAEAIAEAAREKAQQEAAMAAAQAAKEADERERREREKGEAAEKARIEQEAMRRQAEERADALRVRTHGDYLRAIIRHEISVAPAASSEMVRQALADLPALYRRDWEEFATRAEEARANAQSILEGRLEGALAREDAERKRFAAEVEARRVREAEQAKIDARAKLDAEIAAANEAATKRAANVAHQRAINRDIVGAFCLAMSEVHSGDGEEAAAIARALVEAIAKNLIPNVTINY